MTEMLRTLLCGALLITAIPALADDAPVSRVPRISDHPSDPVLKQLFDDTRARGGQIINLHLVQGHAPKLAKARREMAYAIRFETVTPALMREVAIIRTGQIVGSTYEHNQHVPLAKACGFSDAQLNALESWKASNLFDDRTRALLGYVDAVVGNRGDVDDATYGAFAKHFTPQEIVEITMIVGNYVATGLLTKALKVQVETDGRGAVRGRC
jgi:alkylhydroperoxidase family enzyme